MGLKALRQRIDDAFSLWVHHCVRKDTGRRYLCECNDEPAAGCPEGQVLYDRLQKLQVERVLLEQP